MKVSCYHVAACVGLSIAVFTGCNDKPAGIEFGKVTGLVTLNDEPLPEALVVFQPAAGRPSFGRTNAEGVYSLSYKGKAWGAVVGDHEVKITTENRFENQETGEVRVVKEMLPAQYHARSTLTASVSPGENTIDFALEAKKR